MTPKEKAKELVGKFQFIYVEPMYLLSAKKHSKECALIAVDEIINNTIGQGSSGIEVDQEEIYSNIEYWQQVKQEIEKQS